MYDAVFFDLDATLLDTEKLLEDSIQDVLRNMYQVEFSESEIEAIRGSPDLGPGSWAELAIRRFNLHGVTTETALNEAVYKIVDTNIEFCAAMPGAAKVVAALAAAGIPIALVTSSREDSMYLKIKNHDYMFRHMRTFVPVEHVEPLSKPHPNCYLLAAKRLNVDITRCLVVEDSVIGATAGVSAGATVISVPQRYHVSAVEALGVKHIYSTLEEWDLHQFFPQRINKNYLSSADYVGDSMQVFLETCITKSTPLPFEKECTILTSFSSTNSLSDMSALSTPLPPALPDTIV